MVVKVSNCIAAAVSYGRKILMKSTPGACIIKLITAVIYGFCNELERLSLASLSSLV
jgi:hypothetical protein